MPAHTPRNNFEFASEPARFGEAMWWHCATAAVVVDERGVVVDGNPAWAIFRSSFDRAAPLADVGQEYLAAWRDCSLFAGGDYRAAIDELAECLSAARRGETPSQAILSVSESNAAPSRAVRVTAARLEPRADSRLLVLHDEAQPPAAVPPRDFEDRMQAFFHESETGCFRTDSDGRLLEVNRALVSMLGHETAEEMLRERGADEIFADRESGARLRRQYDATGVIVGAESRLVDRKGGTRHVILNARVMPMDGGEWFRHEYSAVDVSHRKHQAAVLDEQLQRFRRFADSSPYILFIVDPALDRVLYVNEAYERIFGRSTEGLYADRRDWLNAVHPQDLERVTKSLAGMSNHWQFDETFRIARGDGGVRWIHDRIFPIHSQDGQKVWLAGLAEDVTERRLAERERKRFIALSLDLICTLSFDGAIRRLNPAWQKVLGFSLGEIYVLSLEELIHPEDLDATLAKIQELAGGVATTHFENRMRCADGGWKSIAWAAVPDMEQKLIHAVGRDMTEQRRVEAMGRQQERDLAHLNRLRTVANLAYGLAHELNQPLFAIANFAAASAEALAADTSASAARMLEWNRRIGEQAVRAGEIVRRLATFSSKPNGARQPADVNALVAEAIRLVSLDAHWHGVRLNFAPGGDLPSVMADEILIEQVLVNLLRNAFESMVDTRDELRELVIRVRSCDEGVGVSVRDHGHGASPEQMAAAFDASFTSKRDGHGMGLSISKRIIESHGGRIWAEHHAGDGLTMHFTLATEAKVQP